MATVPNLDGGNVRGGTTTTDYSLVKPNREVAGTPNGATTPLFVGEIIQDVTNDALWQAMDASNDNWVALTPLPGDGTT